MANERKERIRNLPREAVQRGYLYTLLALVLGVVLLISPDKSVWFVYGTAAGGLILLGLWRVWKYFRIDDTEEGKEHQVLSQGLVLAMGGILLFIYMHRTAELLPVIVGAVMLFIAAIRTQAAVDLKRAGARPWFAPLIAAGLFALCGVLVLAIGFEQHVFMIMLGVVLVAEAVCDFLCRLLDGFLERSRPAPSAEDELERLKKAEEKKPLFQRAGTGEKENAES